MDGRYACTANCKRTAISIWFFKLQQDIADNARIHPSTNGITDIKKEIRGRGDI